MKRRFKQFAGLTVLLFSALFFCFSVSFADTIVFKDGTKMEVKTAWQEGDQVKTEKYGGIVSYPISKVEKIIKGEYNYLEEKNKQPQAPVPKDIIEEIPEFIQVKAFSTKVAESSDDYAYISWEATIYSEKAGKTLISINFYDQQKNVVNKDLKEVTLALGNNSVADMTMVKCDLYKKVNTTGISIKEQE